jgi:hypothetical protein
MNPLYHLDIRAGMPDLKSNDQAEPSVNPLANAFDAFASLDIRSNGLLTIDMFTCLDSSLHELRMGIRPVKRSAPHLPPCSEAIEDKPSTRDKYLLFE